MKKRYLLTIILSFIILVMNVNAKTITDGETEIEIESITLELYNMSGEEDAYMCMDTESYEFSIYCNPEVVIDVTEDFQISESYTNDRWDISKAYDVRLLDLNLNLETAFAKFKNSITNLENEYLGVIFINYSYQSIPTNYNKFYYIDTMNVTYSSLMSSFSGNEFSIYNTNINENIKQPIYYAAYQSGEYLSFENVEDYTDLDSLAMLLNYTILSQSTSNTFVENELEESIYYIHSINDPENIGDYIEELHKPNVYIVDSSDNYITLSIYSANDETCEIYRSNSEDGVYKKIDTVSCNIDYTDDGLEPDTYYYYKVRNNNNYESDILEAKTHELISDENTTQTTPNKNNNTIIDKIENNNNNNDNSSEDEKIYGTVENSGTGVYSNIIFGVAIIVISLIFIKYNKNKMKRKI